MNGDVFKSVDAPLQPGICYFVFLAADGRLLEDLIVLCAELRVAQSIAIHVPLALGSAGPRFRILGPS